MANSYATYTGTGSQTDWSFPFSYLSQDDVFVFVDAVSAPFTFITDSSVRLTTAPASGASVQIRRITDKTAVPVDFVDGSNLLESDLDRLAVWALYVAQESADNSGDSTVALAQSLAALLLAQQLASVATPYYRHTQTFTATGGQTVFTVDFAYALGTDAIAVSINGVEQAPSAYAETSITSITVSEALTAGDIVVVRTVS